MQPRLSISAESSGLRKVRFSDRTAHIVANSFPAETPSVDISTLERRLQRPLGDNYAFNDKWKRNSLHKSWYFNSFDKKFTVKFLALVLNKRAPMKV